MTFQLRDDELQAAFEAIEHHGYGALLPEPPEWSVVRAHWTAIKPEIAQIDLDKYAPSPPLRVYAPKSRATVRVVSLLHPVDLIIYSALTLIVKDDLERARIPPAKNRVFSYRSPIGVPNRLYVHGNSYSIFRQHLERKSRRSSVRYVAIADIADFFPRIYQHRLENVIESCASTSRAKDVARVLVRKFISNISGKNSYGIPVGPYASRILAEAVLIDVDSYLVSESFDFVRWVDDYFFFAKTEQEAQQILINLAERLYEKHGLTLSALKTKIQSVDQFSRRFQVDPDQQIDERLARVREFSLRFNPYTEEIIELSEQEIAELVELDIAQFIMEALQDRDLVDYESISSILQHPEVLSNLPIDSRRNIGDILLDNIQHLYPVAAEVAKFFSSFSDQTWKVRKRIRTRLLNSLRPKKGRWPPDYYMIWILSIFAANSVWKESPEYSRIFRDHRSDAVRRMAALAIAANGTRADAVEAKDRFAAASKLEQLAILLASRKLGTDERKHWKTSLQLTGTLEKLL